MFSRHLAIAILALAAASTAAAQTPFAGEDFDGGMTNGGFTSVTQVLTPDNSGNGDGGRFDGGSFFDLFGIVNRVDNNLPFDFVDDSGDAFPGDVAGILESDDTSNVILLADTVNGDNPSADGSVTAQWTFDIAGRSNIELSIDFAAQGTFDPGDTFVFSYSIDGGPSTQAIAVEVDPNETVFTGISLEGGAFTDRIDSPFFDDIAFEDLQALAAMGGAGIPFTIGGDTFDFHTLDDGVTNGDSVAEDGFIPVEFLSGVEEIAAINETNGFGSFDNTVSEAFIALFANGGQGEGTELSDEFQTVTVPVAGEGSTLTLDFFGIADGSLEGFIFDNILLSEGEVVAQPGDFNGDGVVDAADYTVWRDNLGSEEGDLLNGNGNGGTIDETDYQLFVDNFGSGAGQAVAVPEPTAVLLTGFVAAAFGLRARR